MNNYQASCNTHATLCITYCILCFLCFYYITHVKFNASSISGNKNVIVSGSDVLDKMAVCVHHRQWSSLDSVHKGQPAAPIAGIEHFNAQTVQELSSRARSERSATPYEVQCCTEADVLTWIRMPHIPTHASPIHLIKLSKGPLDRYIRTEKDVRWGRLERKCSVYKPLPKAVNNSSLAEEEGVHAPNN